MNRGLIVVAIAALPAVGGMQALAAGAQGPAQIAHAECGACHNFYLPQLLPKESWTLILGHLSDHFGEDASLPADEVAKIKAYLTANAEPAPPLTPAQTPHRITDQAWWKRIHGQRLQARAAADPAIRTMANCAGCHSGLD